MSTITFAATTLWNNSATGRGRPQMSHAPDVTNYILKQVPGNGSLVAINNGIQPGGIVISARYWLASGDKSSLVSTIESLRSSRGTVTFPPDTSVANCILIRADFSNTPVQPREGSTHRYEHFVTYQFQRLG